MKHFKNAASKMSSRGAVKFNALANEDVLHDGKDHAPVWTTGQEFQFYVPWLWKDSPDPPHAPPDKLHPDRKVVRIDQHPNLLECTKESLDAWIQHSVTNAVKDLVYDKEHYLTCTEGQLEEWHYDRTKAWEHFNIVQSRCRLPEVKLPGYDGVLPVEMTIVIKKVSIRLGQTSSSSCLDWLTLPSPGKCIERIKNQVRIYLTSDCSIHIHIRPESMLDSLQSLKKMASMLWLAEERLNKLYHPTRNHPDSPFNRSLRRYSNLAMDDDPLATGRLEDHATWLGPVNRDVGEEGKLTTIWQALDIYQLRELLRVHPSIGKHDRPAYNFFNLFAASEKQTIEFRKMEAMIDAQVVDAWIEVFLLLTNFCMTCSVEQFQAAMGNLSKPDNVYNTWHFLRDIGCKGPTVELLKRKFMQQRLTEEQTSHPASELRPASITSSLSSTRLRVAIRNRAKKVGEKIAEGYSYSR